MNSITTITIIFVVFIIWYLFFYQRVSYIVSSIDNNVYMIRRNGLSQGDLLNSANTLAVINQRIIKLIDHLNLNKLNLDIPIKYLTENYNHSILSEAFVDKNYTTFTVDKGSIHICLRTRDTNDKIYDINTLMYVLLHELAHLCNYNKNGYPIYGHGIEFLQIFKVLVQESIKINIYTYQDYQKNPTEYCGLQISSQIV
jgi:predicted SprT family Zn-dependent metalloprotease